jgi:hypothetical protein
MKNLYEAATANEVRERIALLAPDTRPLWGTMNPAQALAHCAEAMKMATGETVPPRIFIGRLVGSLARKRMIVQGKPMPRNVKTHPILLAPANSDFHAERRRLIEIMDRFIAAGPERCSKHPHFFFGPLTPTEWSSLMYRHIDHHLRQFQA